MKSMTGFGVARRQVSGWEVRAEVQTLNGRFLALRLRLSEAVRDLTPVVEERLKAAFARGTVHCRVSLSLPAQPGGHSVDMDRLEALCRSVQELRGRLGLAGEVSPEWLLAVPGVAAELAIAGPEREVLEKVVLEAVEEAVASALEVRGAEGQRLRQYLVEHLEEMRRLLSVLRERAPAAVQAYRERLRGRMEELLVGTGVSAAGETLEREVAYMAERSDVTEELNRIDGHLEEVARCLEAEGVVGRTLEFLAQELGREAGTLAAKALDVEMSGVAVGFRQEVDRLREQVANVE